MLLKALNIVILLVGILIVIVGTLALINGKYLAIVSYVIGWCFINEYRNNLNYL